MITSKNTTRALEIIEILDREAKNNGHFIHIENISEDPKNLRRAIMLFSKDKDWRKRLLTSISDDRKILFVKLKEKSRIDILEELLFKVMLSVDNERLYDEIYYTLYGGKNGNGQE